MSIGSPESPESLFQSQNELQFANEQAHIERAYEHGQKAAAVLEHKGTMPIVGPLTIAAFSTYHRLRQSHSLKRAEQIRSKSIEALVAHTISQTEDFLQLSGPLLVTEAEDFMREINWSATYEAERVLFEQQELRSQTQSSGALHPYWDMPHTADRSAEATDCMSHAKMWERQTTRSEAEASRLHGRKARKKAELIEDCKTRASKEFVIYQALETIIEDDKLS